MSIERFPGSYVDESGVKSRMQLQFKRYGDDRKGGRARDVEGNGWRAEQDRSGEMDVILSENKGTECSFH